MASRCASNRYSCIICIPFTRKFLQGSLDLPKKQRGWVQQGHGPFSDHLPYFSPRKFIVADVTEIWNRNYGAGVLDEIFSLYKQGGGELTAERQAISRRIQKVMRFKGFGGTDFRPAFRYVDGLRQSLFAF